MNKPSDISRQAANQLNRWFSTYQAQDILFLSSGGSALTILPYLSPELIKDNVTISVVDERFSRNPKINNFAQLIRTNFYFGVKDSGVKFIDTQPVLGESQSGLASRFDLELKNWVQNHPNGKIIATLGLGSDGHMAGIFPRPRHPELFTKIYVETDHWTVACRSGSKNPYPQRVTTTIPFLKLIQNAIFFVMGEDKSLALHKVYAPTGSLADTPGRLIRLLSDVRLFTDIQL